MNKAFDKLNVLFDKLVPASGNCETIEGELVRAMMRLVYDNYNNGLCNNVTGAFNFIENQSGNYPELDAIVDLLAPFSHMFDGSHYPVSDEGVEVAMVSASDIMCEFVEGRELTPNVDDLDMLDFSDPDPDLNDDEDEGYWGHDYYDEDDDEYDDEYER